jgi:hypothetical protein
MPEAPFASLYISENCNITRILNQLISSELCSWISVVSTYYVAGHVESIRLYSFALQDDHAHY